MLIHTPESAVTMVYHYLKTHAKSMFLEEGMLAAGVVHLPCGVEPYVIFLWEPYLTSLCPLPTQKLLL